MNNGNSFGGVLRRLAFFAVLGFLVVILIGPIIAILSAFFAIGIAFLSIVFPFVLIGFMVWVPYTILKGRPVPWQQMLDTAKGIVHFLVVWPMQMGQRLWTGAVNFTRSAADWASYYGSIVMEMIAGALLGGLVAAVTHWEKEPDASAEIALGAFIGLVVGAVVGLANRRSAQVTASRNNQ